MCDIRICTCVQMLMRPEESTGSPGAGVKGSYELGAGNLSSGPLQEQQVLLTTEPSLQPKDLFLLVVI